MLKTQWVIAIGIAVGFSCLGCQKVNLKLVDASVQKPSNVALYFTVDDKEKKPVPGLTAEQFRIYEDGKLISTYESQQTILNPEVATVRYTLLLLDMSGSIVESGQLPMVKEAAGAFLENIGEQEKVAIYAFDGRADVIKITDFESREGRLKGGLRGLTAWKTKDPSTNLNGAIVGAADVLGKEMEESEAPLRFGTVVVFTDGTDRAARASASDAINAVKDNDLSLYVIGLGGEVDTEGLQTLGKDGFVHAENNETVVAAFAKVAEQIHGLASRYYLLSYCSPARAGRHELKVEAVVGEQTGRLGYSFDAEGFEANCDPNTAPVFEVPGTKTSRGKIRETAKKNSLQ